MGYGLRERGTARNTLNGVASHAFMVRAAGLWRHVVQRLREAPRAAAASVFQRSTVKCLKNTLDI